MSDESQSQQPDLEVSSAASTQEPAPPHPSQPVHSHASRRQTAAAGIGIAGWLVPGFGHALQKMWGRAAACFLAVGILVIIGSGMRGNLFQSQDSDAFGRLGYVADVGTGSFYFLARWMEVKGPDV